MCATLLEARYEAFRLIVSGVVKQLLQACLHP